MKELFFKLTYILQIHHLVRLLFQRKKTTFLLFHELPLNAAQKILPYLDRYYSIITLDEYMEYCYNKTTGSMPDFPMVLTFDDGRKSNMELIQLFSSMSIRPTIYVCSDNKEQDGYELFNREDFEKAKVPYDLQAHTITHPNLKETPTKEAAYEIGHSKVMLEEMLEQPITSFAYPYGKYTERDVELAREAGYSNAVTVDFGFNDVNTDLFRLNRICISDQPSVHETAIKACGLWGYIKGALHVFRS